MNTLKTFEEGDRGCRIFADLSRWYKFKLSDSLDLNCRILLSAFEQWIERADCKQGAHIVMSYLASFCPIIGTYSVYWENRCKSTWCAWHTRHFQEHLWSPRSLEFCTENQCGYGSSWVVSFHMLPALPELPNVSSFCSKLAISLHSDTSTLWPSSAVGWLFYLDLK